jgi:hypothetical protein
VAVVAAICGTPATFVAGVAVVAADSAWAFAQGNSYSKLDGRGPSKRCFRAHQGNERLSLRSRRRLGFRGVRGSRSMSQGPPQRGSAPIPFYPLRAVDWNGTTRPEQCLDDPRLQGPSAGARTSPHRQWAWAPQLVNRLRSRLAIGRELCLPPPLCCRTGRRGRAFVRRFQEPKFNKLPSVGCTCRSVEQGRDPNPARIAEILSSELACLRHESHLSSYSYAQRVCFFYST